MKPEELAELHYLLIKFKDVERAGHVLSQHIDAVLDEVEAHARYRRLVQ